MVTTKKTIKEGIVVSLPGVLKRAADACRRSKADAYLAFSLEELLKHLEMVRANPERVGEFFDLYVGD